MQQQLLHPSLWCNEGNSTRTMFHLCVRALLPCCTILVSVAVMQLVSLVAPHPHASCSSNQCGHCAAHGATFRFNTELILHQGNQSESLRADWLLTKACDTNHFLFIFHSYFTRCPSKSSIPVGVFFFLPFW